MLMFRIKGAALARTVMACLISVGAVAVNIAAGEHRSGGGERAIQANAGEQLVAERCNTCHAIASVLVRRAPPEEWQELVDRMVTYGAQVNGEEVEAIVRYLSAEYGLESDS